MVFEKIIQQNVEQAVSLFKQTNSLFYAFSSKVFVGFNLQRPLTYQNVACSGFISKKKLCYISIMENDLLKRITLNPNVCFGKPTIRNMRYPVEMILDLLGAGMSFEEVLEDYPDLQREDLQACLVFH